MGTRNRPWATDQRTPDFSSPSSSFSLPRLITPEIGGRLSKSTIITRQWPMIVEINRYRSISGENGAETVPIGGTAR
ncbi:hypothetical protein BHM03_00059273 [Ensete ventricosum]|nr:hypothetical protein BHM03_00059273 [Ensete ventricosum]